MDHGHATDLREIGLGVFSKVLGVETPSLKNCASHIAIHQVDIARIEKQSKKLSEAIYDAMDEQTKVDKALAAAKKTLPAPKVGKVAMQLDKVEKALDGVLKATVKVNESIARAEDRQVQFEKALTGMQEGIPGWVKWVDVACGMVVDLVHPQAGPTKALGCPIHFSETPTEITRPAPMLGEHTREVLREHGYADDDIDAFVAGGVVEDASGIVPGSVAQQAEQQV